MPDAPRYILGINAGLHDASATLVAGGEVRAHWSEERLSRIKHDGRYPRRAIEACLQIEGLVPNDIEAIGYSWNYWAYEAAKFRFYVDEAARRGGENPVDARRWVAQTRARKEKLYATFASTDSQTVELFGRPPEHIDHHLCHAYSAIAWSGFEQAAVLVIDGSGEMQTVSIWDHSGADEPRLIWHRDLPHSLGVFYGSITQFLGFRQHDEEWKVMGLAGYGTSSKLEAMRDLLDPETLTLNLSYFQHHNGQFPWYSPGLPERLGLPPAGPGELDGGRLGGYADVAASAQALMEIAVLGLAKRARALTGRDRLVMAGGVALNGLANGAVLRSGFFERVYVPPSAADDGASIGAALALANRRGESIVRRVERVDLGGRYDDDQIAQAIHHEHLSATRVSREALIARTAEAICEGGIVGWFQGRSEIGPRALGFRSILADPSRPEMKDVINRRIKFREAFRPFAPAVLDYAASRLVSGPTSDALFMNQILPVTPEGARAAPATTHVDGTARVQVVRRENNPLYYDLIETVGRRRALPVILNTSFNRKGEPIVETPEDAVACFLGTDLDLLVIGSWLVKRKSAPSQ